MTERDYPAPVSELLALGDCRGQGEWTDYRALGLGPEHVPDLIRMALDEELYWADSEDDVVWAPIHAWRALAQLRAEEAAQPLTRLLYRIDEYGDDWVGEEIPEVLGKLGPTAIPVLADYLADDSHSLWARIAAAQGLQEISERHPGARSAAISALTETLERFAHHDRTLNAFLVSFLVDLDAVEAAPLMKRAFEAEKVDLAVMGDWEDVQMELGLLDERETPSPNTVLSDLSGLWEEVWEKEARRRLREIGRNDPCWCGSGKKYKHCHLRDDQELVRD